MIRPLIAGNWKMFTTRAGAQTLATEIMRGLESGDIADVAICPPFPYLPTVAAVVIASPIALGAQNVYPAPEGAFTGEVSPGMLRDIGCRYVIVGHSERRLLMGESNALVRRKVEAATAAGLRTILCVGETLQQRDQGDTEQVLDEQLTSALEGPGALATENLVLAYEPVWAIGTGRNATPDQAQQAHAFLRGRLRQMFGQEQAAAVPILYGGSVKPENAAALLAQPEVNGALVGGASLVAAQFLAIVRAAAVAKA